MDGGEFRGHRPHVTCTCYIIIAHGLITLFLSFDDDSNEGE